MNSGELTRLNLANRLLCERLQISFGPTGPAGGTAVIPGALKAFTIYLDYSTVNSINRIYIPPNLFTTNPILALGGIFTANVGTDLVFSGTTVTLNNTTYGFISGITAAGYISAGRWQPINGALINPTTGLYYAVTVDNSAVLTGLGLGNINGGQTAIRPATGTAAGFLATVTLFYV